MARSFIVALLKLFSFTTVISLRSVSGSAPFPVLSPQKAKTRKIFNSIFKRATMDHFNHLKFLKF